MANLLSFKSKFLLLLLQFILVPENSLPPSPPSSLNPYHFYRLNVNSLSLLIYANCHNLVAIFDACF